MKNMCKIGEFLSKLESFAPLSLSKKMIEMGDYDNSGLLVKVSENANKILFSLDLSIKAVERAVELGCDTIVTHHPAIYAPIKALEIDGQNQSVLLAIKNNLNVISMHLNLDIASLGIDHFLSLGLGGEGQKVLTKIEGENGYGRIAKVCEQSLSQFVSKIKENFGTDKVIYYGQNSVKNIASFCGSGGAHAVKTLIEKPCFDTVITSDLAHHQLKELIECGVNVVIIPHYASVLFGFNKFYQLISDKLESEQKAFYFIDHRFM